MGVMRCEKCDRYVDLDYDASFVFMRDLIGPWKDGICRDCFENLTTEEMAAILPHLYDGEKAELVELLKDTEPESD